MHPLINETRLLWEAEALLPDLGEPTAEGLAALVAREGIDRATAALYLYVRRRHQPFVEEVERFDPRPGGLPRVERRLWLVPAAGYRERPEYGGDGAVIRDIGRDFGLIPELVPTTSLGSVAANGALLREALAGAEPRSVLLVTLSKGAAELKVALREPGPHHEALCAWVNVGGLSEGSPILNYGRSRPLIWLGVELMMLLRRVDRGFVEGLSHRAPLLAGPLLLPPVSVVSVVGFPLRSHLQGTIGRRHGYLAPQGPNDGYGLLLDEIAPGHVYPVWGASHYLRTPGLSRVFYGIFARLARELG